MDAALDCVVAMDRRGIVVDWNPAAERTFGYAAEEALGREMAELIVPPHLRDAHRAGLARSLAGGAPVVLERRIEITAMRRDGEEFPCELTITRIAEPGEPLFVGYVRDITARRRADAELRASRARIVDAADAARARLERDLHDGAQQRLVGLALTLRLARRKAGLDPALTLELLDEAIADLAGGHRRAARAGARHPPRRPDRGRAGAGARRAGGPRPGPRRAGGRAGAAGCPPRSRRPPTSSSPRP